MKRRSSGGSDSRGRTQCVFQLGAQVHIRRSFFKHQNLYTVHTYIHTCERTSTSSGLTYFNTGDLLRQRPVHTYVHRPLVMSAPHKLSKHQNHGTTKLNSTATDGAPAVHTVKQDHQGPTSRLDAGSLSAQVGHDSVELHS